MNKRTCTETRPCNLATCYSCRRALIDRTALAMLDRGVSQDDVDRYRYPAINALAFEIPTPPPAKPAAKARKPFTPKPEVNYQAIADKLRVCGSREYAAELIANATIPELRHIACLVGRKLSGKVKAQLVSNLIEQTVGYRLDTNAILNGAK